jgi:nucleoid-associated protein YgaU
VSVPSGRHRSDERIEQVFGPTTVSAGEGGGAMASYAALRVSGTTAVAERGGPAVARPALRMERHLRVLPPVPAAFAVLPVRRTPRPASPVARAEPAPLPRLRLTARGRRLVVVLVLALTVGVVSVGTAVLRGDGDGLQLMGTSSVVVQPGDTLWSIARSVADDRDVREVIHSIRQANGLESGDIAPGQVLQLP